MTDTIPKWLLPVRGRPFAAWQFDQLANQGITRVIVASGYLHDRIDAFVASAADNWPFEVIAVTDGERLLGTGGALRRAMDVAEIETGACVLYGDSYLPIDFSAVWSRAGRGRRAVMTVIENDGRWDASNARVEDGLVSRYEKGLDDPAGAGMRHIDYGLSVLPADTVRAAVPVEAVVDLAVVLSGLSAAGELLAFEVAERFYEIGSPEGLRDLERFLG